MQIVDVRVGRFYHPRRLDRVGRTGICAISSRAAISVASVRLPNVRVDAGDDSCASAPLTLVKEIGPLARYMFGHTQTDLCP